MFCNSKINPKMKINFLEDKIYRFRNSYFNALETVFRIIKKIKC
jgi:hypothetical protein